MRQEDVRIEEQQEQVEVEQVAPAASSTPPPPPPPPRKLLSSLTPPPPPPRKFLSTNPFAQMVDNDAFLSTVATGGTYFGGNFDVGGNFEEQATTQVVEKTSQTTEVTQETQLTQLQPVNKLLNVGSNMSISNDILNRNDFGSFYTLFTNCEAVAIGTRLQNNDGDGDRFYYLAVCKVLSQNFQHNVGQLVKWDRRELTSDLGNSIDAIIARIPGHERYLRSCDKQRNYYNKQVGNLRSLAVGDYVLLPIHGVDRGCLGNHNMIAKVVSVENKFCKLGTAEGIIDTKFLMDQLQLVKDGSRIQAFDVPTNRTVSFTAAHKKAGGYKRKKKGDAEAQEEEVEEHEDGK